MSPNNESLLLARLGQKWMSEPACIEASNKVGGLLVVASLCKPTEQEVNIRVMNTASEPIHLRCGKKVAVCMPVEGQEQFQNDCNVTEYLKHLDEHLSR